MTRSDRRTPYAGGAARRTSASSSSIWDRIACIAVATSPSVAGFRERSTSASTSSPRRMLAGVEPHNFRNAAQVSSSTATRATRAPTAWRFARRPGEREGRGAGGAGGPATTSSGSVARRISAAADARSATPRSRFRRLLRPMFGTVAPRYTAFNATACPLSCLRVSDAGGLGRPLPFRVLTLVRSAVALLRHAVVSGVGRSRFWLPSRCIARESTRFHAGQAAIATTRRSALSAETNHKRPSGRGSRARAQCPNAFDERPWARRRCCGHDSPPLDRYPDRFRQRIASGSLPNRRVRPDEASCCRVWLALIS
jgi:hypothetical protein